MASSLDKPERRIVIVGGGIIGCSTAYYLTRHPSYDSSKHEILILEATEIAGGASGKAGGLLALWAYPSNIVPLSFRLHAELAKEHNGKDRWGYRNVNCGELMARVLPKRRQTTSATENEGESVSLEKRSEEAKASLQAAGIPADLDWFDPSTLSGYEDMAKPDMTAQVHPYHFTTSMAQLAEEKGVKTIFGSVTGIEPSGDDGLSTVKYKNRETGSSETISATDVVLSAGPWTKRILPRAPIAGLRAHSVVIRPSRPVSAYAVFTSISLPKPEPASHGATVVAPEIYARPDNTVYACGEGDREVSLPATTASVEVDDSKCQSIIDSVSAISKELRDGEVVARQACYLPNVTVRGTGPLIGPTDMKGVYLAAGHTCWGIQNAPGTGKLMSELIFDGKARSADISTLDPRNIL